MKTTFILAALLATLSANAFAQSAQESHNDQPAQVASADDNPGSQSAANSPVADQDRYAAHPHISKFMVDTYWPAQGDVNWLKRPGR